MNKDVMWKVAAAVASIGVVAFSGKEYGHSQGTAQAKESCANTIEKVVVPQYVKCPEVKFPKIIAECGPSRKKEE